MINRSSVFFKTINENQKHGFHFLFIITAFFLCLITTNIRTNVAPTSKTIAEAAVLHKARPWKYSSYQLQFEIVRWDSKQSGISLPLANQILVYKWLVASAPINNVTNVAIITVPINMAVMMEYFTISINNWSS